MLTIYKYQVARKHNQYGAFNLDLPNNAVVISVIMQNGLITIYAQVDTTEMLIPREIYVAGTGKELPVDIHNYQFIGTVVDEPFVWHVYIRN